MKKEIECYISANEMERLQNTVDYSAMVSCDHVVVGNFSNSDLTFKATLTIHDYPEEKIELTRSQIRETMKGYYSDVHQDSIFKRLGFKGRGE